MNRYEKEVKEQRKDYLEKQREETMDEEKLKEECHYLKKIPVGDEGYYWCDLSDHPCSKEYNDEECEEYTDFVAEIIKEEGERKKWNS